MLEDCGSHARAQYDAPRKTEPDHLPERSSFDRKTIKHEVERRFQAAGH